MKTVISRRYSPLQTTGRLVVFNEDIKALELVTIELPDEDNKKSISCIPEGTYPMKKIKSLNFGNCFLVTNVPGRSNILIHVGNYASGKKVDTEGCILPGTRFSDINNDGQIDVADSGTALKRLWAVLPNESTLIII